jgi:hypothetical protein
MENDGITWEEICAYVDTLQKSGEPEYQEENRQKTRVARLKWDPDARTHAIYYDEILREVEKDESSLS